MKLPWKIVASVDPKYIRIMDTENKVIATMAGCAQEDGLNAYFIWRAVVCYTRDCPEKQS